MEQYNESTWKKLEKLQTFKPTNEYAARVKALMDGNSCTKYKKHYASKENLKEHIRATHLAGTFICKIAKCKEAEPKFATKKRLTNHIKKNHNKYV